MRNSKFTCKVPEKSQSPYQPSLSIHTHPQVLLTKGANKLARNKKGRKPGDVFSPTVEDDKKERIKNMLGMGTGQAQDAPTSAAAVPVASSAGAAATATAVAKAVGRASAENSAATRANTSASSGVLHAAEGNGVAATVQPVAAPVYKVREGKLGGGAGGKEGGVERGRPLGFILVSLCASSVLW